MTIELSSKIDQLEKARKIVELIGTYRLKTNQDDEFEQKGIQKLIEKVLEMMKNDECIQIVLPAFAFKSPNIRTKTLGVLPDKAEEIALSHLQGLIENIFRMYEKGALVTIVSDGLVYNDLLGVQDETVFEYGQELRKMAKEIGAKNIRFKRVNDLLGYPEIQDKEQYCLQAPMIRKELLNRYGYTKEGFEKQIDQQKDSISDSQRTFIAYQAILADDLDSIDPLDREKVNFEMIQRGKCFAKLILDTIPTHIRLSIHPSSNVEKVSISLTVKTTSILKYDLVNPWHGCIVQFADGSWTMTNRGSIDENQFEVEMKDGRPWLLREKANVFEWKGMKVNFEPLYPCGMVITPNQTQQAQFEKVDMKKVRSLALSNSPLLLRGFSMKVEKEIFREKAKELGKVVMWPFGDILEVRENSEINMNNVLTKEAMPFHYDGVFVTIKDENGKPKSNPPLFQMFRNKSSNMKGGLTLFSSSRNIIPLLDGETRFEDLQNVHWETFTTSNDAFGGDELILPLFIKHPISGQITFRFHEPWPQSKTANCNPTLVKLIGYSDQKSDSICQKLTDLLYDHRTCFYHSWQEGDFVFNDNMTTHHTRSAFSGGYREHWRVHVN